MTAEDDLAASVRAALAGTGTIGQVKMFGGIGFMLDGNMVDTAALSEAALKTSLREAVAFVGTPPPKPARTQPKRKGMRQ